jgi:hypothetical protein
MMVIDNKYEIGQSVWLKTDKDQCERIVTAVLVTGLHSSRITYQLGCGAGESWHEEYEMTDEKNVLKTTGE